MDTHKLEKQEFNYIDIFLLYNYNIIMSDIKFQWNDNKNKINQKKHKISFEEAQSVLYALYLQEKLL